MGFSVAQSKAALLRAGGVVELAANLLATRHQYCTAAPQVEAASPRISLQLGHVKSSAVVGTFEPAGSRKLPAHTVHSTTIMATPATLEYLSGAAAYGGNAVSSSAGTLADQTHAAAVGVLSPSMQHGGASSTDISDDECTECNAGRTRESAVPSNLFEFAATQGQSAGEAPVHGSVSNPPTVLHALFSTADAGAWLSETHNSDLPPFSRVTSGGMPDSAVQATRAAAESDESTRHQSSSARLENAQLSIQRSTGILNITPQEGLMLVDQGHSAANIFFAHEESVSVNSASEF
jgi:hypothetical protein